MALRSKTTSALVAKIHAAIDEAFEEHLEQCRNFLRLKSVSATGEGIHETAR